MRRIFQKTVWVFAFLTLSACGFQPVYGPRGGGDIGVEDHLALVEIGSIPNREGQYLRNALIDRFYRFERPAHKAYILDLEPLKERFMNLDITKTAASTRGQLRLETTLTLRDQITKETLLTRRLRAITSYNILGSKFATRVSEENARSNALDDLARQIEVQLNLYFRRDQS